MLRNTDRMRAVLVVLAGLVCLVYGKGGVREWLEGPPGPQGPKGDRGSPGLPGEPGYLGMKGEQGELGQPGRDGLPGLNVVEGEQGLQGLKGMQGNRGMDGLPGLNGFKGEYGPVGRQGPEGPIGSPGLPAEAGQPGLPGLDGAAGSDGIPGLPGPRGIPGELGLTGTSGFPGLPGQKGIAGPKSDQGLKGDRGESSFDGRPGLPGLPGQKGEMGSCSCNGGNTDTLAPPSSTHTSSPSDKVAFTATAFDVQQRSTEWVTITYDSLLLNDGAGIDQETGVFTTPISGVYSLSVNVVADGDGATPTVLFLNEDQIAASGRKNIETMGSFPLGHVQVVVRLQQGDELKLKIKPKETGFIGGIFSKFKDPSDVTFVGYLLYADEVEVIGEPTTTMSDGQDIQQEYGYWKDY